MAALSDYLENKLIDWLLRGQAFVPPATLYVGLATSLGNDAAAGVEVVGGSYARVAAPCNLLNWSGTQAAGSVLASSGTSGTSSNNIAIQFPTPTANWGAVAEFVVFDAPVGGNMLWRAPLPAVVNVNNGDSAPAFAPAALSLQIDY